MFAAYLHKIDMEVYKLNDQEVKMVASGSLDSIKPFTGWGKKVMIVGRDVFLHTRKRYPPTTSGNISKAIEMDIKDIFPLKNPDFTFKIFEKSDTYSLVDIWAWDCSNYKEIKRVFPFTHVLPEDAAFISGEPEITVFEGQTLKHLIAHNKDGFLGGSSMRRLTDKGFETFLRSLGRYANGIKTIRHHINGSRLNPPETLSIVYEDQKEYPPCLKYIRIKKINLKDFRVSHKIPLNFNVDLLMRVLIYCLLAYSGALLLTGRKYEDAINEIIVKLDTLTNGLPEVRLRGETDKYANIIKKLNEKRNSIADPLLITNELAKSLPEGSYITKMTLNGKRLEINLSSKEPLDVIRDLSVAKYVKSVKLKGVPSKRFKSDSYNFLLSLELSTCR